MPTLQLYRVQPNSAFHFGRRGVELEETGRHFPSDSFFAALLLTALEAGHDPGGLAALFPRTGADDRLEPPFLLSSFLPRAGETRFYPALPLGLMLSSEKLDHLHQSHRLKEVKKIRYISEALFEAVCGGDFLDAWVPADRQPQDADRGLYLQGGALWLSREEIERLPDDLGRTDRAGDRLKALRAAAVWEVETAPRVTVDRLRQASNIFHTGRLIFGPDCGFWFGIEWRHPEISPAGSSATIRQIVTETLHLMADGGIGAERNAGYGHFSWREWGQKRLADPAPGERFVTLSRYHPHSGEMPAIMTHDRIAYELVSVGGWLQTPDPGEKTQRRRRLWLFTEGSTLRMPAEAACLGDLVDVRPTYPARDFSHPVWRYGLALPVGLGGAS